MIHAYQLNGYNIAIDVNSGAVHLLDDEAYAALSSGNWHTAQDAPSAELRALRDQGLLDSPEPIIPPAKTSPVVKALCLLVAQDCNMACKYCFAGEGAYHGERGLMTIETAKAAVDFLLANCGTRRNLEIDFFGGEPLLNWQVVTETTRYAEEQAAAKNKRVRLTLTTNGLLLDDGKIDFLNSHMANVVLSLDGRREVNDALRVTQGGNGTYDAVAPKLRRLAEKRGDKPHYIRGTFTKANMDFAEDALHLASLGFRHVSVEPAVGAFGFDEGDLPALKAEYERLAAIMAKGANFDFFHFNVDLSGGPCAKKRLSGCGAGAEYAAVAVNGDIYPCHQFAGEAAFKMGDVWGGVTRPDTRESFEACGLLSKADCRACWAKFFCGGGCAANAYQANGDIHKPHKIGCELQRKRTECAVMIQAARS